MFRNLCVMLMLLCVFAPLTFGQGVATSANKDDWEEINFEFNSSILSDGYPSLLRIAELLAKNPGFKVKVDGNADWIGSNQYNDKLAMRRAETVKAFLVKYGATANQIETVSRGKRQPKVDNKSKEGRFMNRRVQLTVTDAQGRVISEGGAAQAIKAMTAEVKPPRDCCDDILRRLDKLDDILAMLRKMGEANAGLRQELDDLKKEHAALKQQIEGMPKPVTKPEVAEVAREVAGEAVKELKPKRFSLLGLNVGADADANHERHVTFTGKGRYFAPFNNRFAFQAEGEYLYFRDRKEGQLDFGLVNRFTRRGQVGTFASFKHVTLRGMQDGGTLGQGSLTLDYLFKGGRIGLFGSKGFMDGAVVNRRVIGQNLLEETYLRTVDQVGGSTTLGLFDKTYLEANLGYLKSRVSDDKPGGTIRLVHPVSEHIALTLEGGFNETLVGRDSTGRVVAGVMFGSFLRPKEYLDVDHPVPAEIPRVRYEVLTRRVRTGNAPPVADAGADQIGVQAGVITLDGSASFDPDGDPITFQWTQIAGPAVALSAPTAARTTFTAAEGQSYSFRLTVKDDKGAQGIARVTVTTAAAPQVQIVRFTANPSTIRQGQTSVISWQVLNADTVEITGLGQVDPRSGTATVAPRETTQYRLTARNRRGEISETIAITVDQPPVRLLSCQAIPINITAGESSVLSWVSDNADTVSIAPGVGNVPRSGNVSVTPTATTNYTITASNAFGSTDCSVTVQVTPGTMPRIIRFTGAPLQIIAGDKATLFWGVENATEVTITGLGKVDLIGTSDVTPTQTSTYTLTSKNRVGEVNSTVTITVLPSVSIAACAASPATSSAPGQQVTLTYTTQNAADVIIAGIGSVPPNGPVLVRPLADTTYTITAVGRNGAQASCQVTVKVTATTTPPPPPPPPTDNPPVAVIKGGPVIETVIREVKLDGRGSTSPINLPLTYQWTSRHSAAAILDSSSPTPTVQLGELFGDYFFDLVVTDTRGVSSAVATIIVRLVVTRVP